MNARIQPELLQTMPHSTHPDHLSNAHLDALEEETIFILREVAAAIERPTLLFSGGKDSLVMLKCAEKAFGIGRIPYPLLMIDTSDASRVKFNPLAEWSWGDVWHFIAQNHVAYNPLHDQFFPSIGCAPCTRAISLGEDVRAGRWWWEDEAAKECGLHVKPDEQAEATTERALP